MSVGVSFGLFSSKNILERKEEHTLLINQLLSLFSKLITALFNHFAVGSPNNYNNSKIKQLFNTNLAKLLSFFINNNRNNIFINRLFILKLSWFNRYAYFFLFFSMMIMMSSCCYC
jgi:hypothetical protein